MPEIIGGLIVKKTGELWTYEKTDTGVPGLLVYRDSAGGTHGVYADEVDALIRDGYFAGGAGGKE